MKESEMKQKPTEPCLICKTNNWWLRTAWGKGEYICGVCHPEPRGVDGGKTAR